MLSPFEKRWQRTYAGLDFQDLAKAFKTLIHAAHEARSGWTTKTSNHLR